MQHSDAETLIQMEKDLLNVRLTRDPEAVEAFGKVANSASAVNS